jgi:selenocysteine lyase/cysteine desulfurase
VGAATPLSETLAWRTDLKVDTYTARYTANRSGMGVWNEIAFPDTAQRYEPDVLNIAGVYGMRAAPELLMAAGINRVATRILDLKKQIVESLEPLGFELFAASAGPNTTGITTFRHPRANMRKLARRLEENGVAASLRYNREGAAFIRFSPHFYNTAAECERAVSVLRSRL